MISREKEFESYTIIVERLFFVNVKRDVIFYKAIKLWYCIPIREFIRRLAACRIYIMSSMMNVTVCDKLSVKTISRAT